MVWRDRHLIIVRTVDFLPDKGCNEIRSTEDFVGHDLEILAFIVVDIDVQHAVVCEKPTQYLDSIPHQ